MRAIVWGVALALAAPNIVAAQGVALDSVLLASLRWRSIGPANMSGRITDVEGIPSPSRTFFVAAAAGGIWKTTNAGTTFRPVFDNERVISMGDLAIAPSDTMQVWAGTGEEDSRNSISPGGGIYKSTDGGMTWKLMGLQKTEHIGRIIVHPNNPNIVYVAALGAVWRNNPERGLYKTTDGGQTWQLVKFISDRAGFVDMVMDSRNPDLLFAASWERIRTPFSLKSGGPGSALWKTTDGGRTWTEVKGGGFPATEKGRIGLAMSLSNSSVIYALVEAAPASGKGDGCRASGPGGCGLYRSQDGGATWEWMNGENVRPFYYSQVRVDPKDPNRVYWSSTPVKYSNDGGRNAGNTTVGLHVDHHAMWIDPNDANHIVVGNDGGVGQSWDRGGNWDFINTMALGQFYNISFDMGTPYRVCGGLQDNGSWCGPSRRGGQITNAVWFNVGGGDGFHTAQDPRNPDIIYSESQGGNMGRLNYATNDRVALRKPSWLDSYRMFEDSIFVERADTARPLTPQQQQRVRDLRTRQSADSVSLQLRWNWNTPFFLSPHNPDVFYAGANRVMKSTRRGDDLSAISHDLSTRDTMRIRVSTQTTGGVTSDVTGAETHSTIVSLAESPLRQGLLYAGTDDGNVWTSPDDGKTWTDLTARFRGLLPARTYVSRIEPSRFDAGTFYITFDNHREGDFTPYVFVTTDAGRTFRSLANNLPRGGPDFVHVIREDLVNRDLLYLGTDVAAYVSLDRGASWQKFMNGLPTVPIHDLKIHPRDRELIAGTHGRSIWIIDVAQLQQVKPKVLAAENFLFDSRPALRYGNPPVGGESSGNKTFAVQSPGPGAEIVFYSTGGDTRVTILNARGDTVQAINGLPGRGLQRVTWNLRPRPESVRPLSPAETRDSVFATVRLVTVVDSLKRAGRDSVSLNRVANLIRTQAQAGGGRGGRGGGGGPNSGLVNTFDDRPGESPAVAAARGGGGGRGGFAGPDGELATEIRNLIRAPGGRALLYPRGGGGFGGGGGQPALVDAGEYTVVVTIGSRTLTQKIRVQ
jgi:photosystem II stability/assembly factor-like uncharacterized protein